MKAKYVLLLCSFVLFGCATTFTPFAGLESIGDAANSNDDIEATVGIQPIGKNNRFQEKINERKISILTLKVKNKSTQSINITDDGIYLRAVPDTGAISQLTPSAVTEKVKLATGTYWAWCLAWMIYYSDVDGKVSHLYIPVGLPIAMYNYFKALDTNEDFENELTNHKFPNGSIASGDQARGMLYFDRAGGNHYNLVISYKNAAGEKKELVIPYKI